MNRSPLALVSRLSPRLRVALLGGLATAALATAPATYAAPADQAASPGISMAAFTFAPGDLSVSLGTTVTWTNGQDGVPHTTTSTDGVWDSGSLSASDAFGVTFDRAGDFGYVCTIHPSMHGTVHVS
jgi:plastocyanin